MSAAGLVEDVSIARSGVMYYAYREMLRPRMVGIVVTTLCAVVGVFAVIGPAGTLETFSPVRRLWYWSMCVLLAWPICYFKSVLTLYLMRARSPVAISITLAVVTLISAVPVTAIVYAVDTRMRPGYVETLAAADAPALAGALMVYVMTVTVMTATTFLIHYVVGRRVSHAYALAASNSLSSGMPGALMANRTPPEGRPNGVARPSRAGATPGWQYAYRECLSVRTTGTALISVALFVVAMTVFGPLGTAADYRTGTRMLYWTLCAGITWPFCYAVSAAVLYVMRLRSPLATMPVTALATLFEGVLCTAVVCAADMLFRPEYAGSKYLLHTYLTVTTVVVLCKFFGHYVIYLRVSRSEAQVRRLQVGDEADPLRHDIAGPARPSSTAPAGATAAGGSPPPTSHGRHDVAVGHAGLFDGLHVDLDNIVYLKMDDHYVEVHTRRDSSLIRMRFADAVAELGDRGVRVHRSYWTAHRSMVGLARRGNRTLLLLADGRSVPVSSTYLPVVRAALTKQAAASGTDR